MLDLKSPVLMARSSASFVRQALSFLLLGSFGVSLLVLLSASVPISEPMVLGGDHLIWILWLVNKSPRIPVFMSCCIARIVGTQFGFCRKEQQYSTGRKKKPAVELFTRTLVSPMWVSPVAVTDTKAFFSQEWRNSPGVPCKRLLFEAAWVFGVPTELSTRTFRWEAPLPVPTTLFIGKRFLPRMLAQICRLKSMFTSFAPPACLMRRHPSRDLSAARVFIPGSVPSP